MLAGINLGVGLLVAGLVTFILVWVFLRLFPRSQQFRQDQMTPFVLPDPTDSNDAVLVIQSGGRVQHLNNVARRLFGLGDNDTADLERLVRLARPSNDFLALCTKEGQKRITVGGQLTEATSYRMPGLYPVTLLTLRPLDLTSALATGSGETSSAILRTITDFNQAIAGNLNLDATLEAILENVGRLVSADILEIKVWDERSQAMIPYRYVQRSDQTRKLLRSEYSQLGDYSIPLIAQRKSIFIAETDEYVALKSNGNTQPATIKSYLGVPLLVADQMIGTLEVGQTSAGVLSQYNVELLNLIAGQSAIAVRNAMLYETEQRRTVELTGLANLAQAVTVGQDLKELFERLVKSITPLFNVEIIGFLLYDEDKHTLEGQSHFKGFLRTLWRCIVPPSLLSSLQTIC